MKQRSDSNWRTLSNEQMDLLQGWLFEENLPYHEVLERVEKQFGIKSSYTSLRRLYQRLANERKIHNFNEMLGWAPDDETQEEVSDVEKRMDASIRKALSIAAFEMALAGPNQMDTRKLRRIMKIIIDSRRLSARERQLALEQQRLLAYAVMDSGKHMRKMREQERAKLPMTPETIAALKNLDIQGLIAALLKPHERASQSADGTSNATGNLDNGSQTSPPGGAPDAH